MPLSVSALLWHECSWVVAVFFRGFGYPLCPKTSLRAKNIQLFLFWGCIWFGPLMACLSHWLGCVTPGCVTSSINSVYFVWKCFKNHFAWTDAVQPMKGWREVKEFCGVCTCTCVRVCVCVSVLLAITCLRSVWIYLTADVWHKSPSVISTVPPQF